MNRASEAERLWCERFRDQQNSGLSVARYCAEHAVSASTFYLWRKRLVKTLLPTSMPLVEVIATPPLAALVSDGVIEIVLPDALIVRLDGEASIARLRQVIAALRDSGSAQVNAQVNA